MKIAYTYTLLRYVHDVASGEFANVGIVVFAPEIRFAGALCRETHGRISKMFPDMNREGFKPLMRYIEAQVDAAGARFQSEFSFDTLPADAGALARSILPHDDSSLQWGPVSGGLCDNPAETLEELFIRYVTQYDDKNALRTRTDDEVWTQFKRALDERLVSSRLQSKKITVADDELEFERAYKNQQWHCLEPISLDLAQPESIKEKAHRWLGQITSLKDAPERFSVYFLVGAPQSADLRSSYANALKILSKVPVEHRIIPEENASEFAEHFRKLVADHERETM